ncbi:conserved protein of unknown function [Petrocella atlantisensis]|uniref:Uncharacterized protein n=1 Tax=Petrocella atlantisensis TaxID=2173034 RepID=A0A3P7PEH1_9FIRM|nr:hypothetical protein [Petrocella atlantisensis]VDN47298.1 conserved protein of unknown function [Petrocella atlantisensis]
MAKKKRYKGHYCKICSEIKANEKFSGKGHINHICKECSSLSVEKRSELVRMRKIMNIECSGFYLSKKDRDNLKKYNKNKKYSEEVREYASRVLDEAQERYEEMQEAMRADEEFYEEDLLDEDFSEEDIYLE